MPPVDDLIQRFQDAQEQLVLQPADLSLRTLASMVDSGAVDIAPMFQRRDRWPVSKQAALIESFLVNIPVPPIYLAEDELGTYSVIDGKQRITAIKQFLADEYPLRGMVRVPEAEGYYFSDLPRVLQNALDFRPIRAVTLLQQSDQELKYEVFYRLNTGGEPLLPQEIRNVVYRGPLNDMLYQLGEHPFLRQQLKIINTKSSAYRKMTDVEYVLRFLTLTESWERFSGDLSHSMNRYMQEYQFASGRKLKDLADLFLRSLTACEAIYGDVAFKRPENGWWRDQALAGMYDAEMVAFAELTDPELRRAMKNSDEVLVETIELFDDPQFEEAVRQGTNTPSRVQYRVERLISAIRAI